MDKFPLTRDGAAAGELEVREEALYTRFTARCRPDREGLWCAWAVGETGELRLGVLEPAGEELVISRRFSRQMTQPLGRLLRGEARPVQSGRRESLSAWRPEPAPARLFRSAWLRGQLQGVRGALARPWAEGVELALPYDPAAPFPLVPMFCLASLRSIGEGRYVLYRFDRSERPREIRDPAREAPEGPAPGQGRDLRF